MSALGGSGRRLFKRKVRRASVLMAVWLPSLIFLVAGEAGAACSDAYRYVSLDQANPPGAQFTDYFKVTDRGDLYGTSYACDETCVPSIALRHGGATVALVWNALGYTANERGIVGGSVLTDPDTFTEQAALFVGRTTLLIPRLPDEATSHVEKITEKGIALVQSVDTNGLLSYYLYTLWRSMTPLDLGSGQIGSLDVTDAAGPPNSLAARALVSGTIFGPGPSDDRAFRYSPPSGPLQLLDPVATEPESWGQAINRDGEVLGYSFVPGRLERIGYWRDGTFQTLFVEGTAAFPTVSNRLLWNDHRLVVITDTNDLNSYLVPSPGLRLNVADLTTGLPAWSLIRDVNNRGDLLGGGGPDRFFLEHSFLLERICPQP